MSNVDRLIEICNSYNPPTFEYADNDTNGIWLYHALSIPLKEELDRARTYRDKLNVYAIVDYLWVPVNILD